ncbi:hypothetical protein ES703_77115 [subsurface metagenome]
MENKVKQELIATISKHLSMSETEAVQFLEKGSEARELINSLTSRAQTSETWEALNEAYKALDRLLTPICPTCQVATKRFITSKAELYDPELAQYPGGTTRYWTGEWYCPQCRHLIAVGRKWWEGGE